MLLDRDRDRYRDRTGTATWTGRGPEGSEEDERILNPTGLGKVLGNIRSFGNHGDQLPTNRILHFAKFLVS